MAYINEHRLYRGQSKQFRDSPLAPSALRGECIDHMEAVLSQHGIDVQKYKQKCIPKRMVKEYCNSEYQPSRVAFFAYWLSLVNCALAVNENPICYKFCRAPFFRNNIDKDGAGVHLLPIDRVADVCFDYAKDFFDSDKQNETYHLQIILHDYSFFQHFNHALSKVNKTQSTLFPTLALDWTWDRCIAEKFAGEGGNILSVLWEAYSEWAPFKNHKVIHLDTKEQRTPVFGFESYLNTPPWNTYDWYSMDNNLMTEQKGAVIFWPWKYRIDQLRSNELGKAFDFRVEK